MSEFTPGPWKEYGLSIYASDGVLDVYIAEMAYGDGTFEVSKEQALANANLIKAAPELLAALEGVALGHMKTHPDGHLVVLTAETWDQVRLAITRARGTS